MSKIKGRLFYKHDKDIWDQLIQQTPSKKSTLNYLKSRGLLLSPDDDKEYIAEYISPWFTSFFDLNFFVEENGGAYSRKRFISSEVLLDYNESNIKALVKQLNSDSDINVTMKKNGDSFALNEVYTTADFTKNALSQNITKVAEIEIKKTPDNKILIRSNNDDQARKITSRIKEKLKHENQDTYDEFLISFATLINSKARTEFFLEILKHIDGYETIDMKSVAIGKLKTLSTDDTELDEKGVGLIKRVVLNGESVHHSKELSNLLTNGFYITRIEWTMISNLQSGDKIDLYAEFRDPNNCSDFMYALQKVYNSKGDGTHNINGKSPSHIENINILPKIEYSAKKSFVLITKQYLQSTDDLENG